ncbi:MAG: LPS translocon maturation chaperone LptM [Porticoccaceae bacterium]
MSRFRQNTILLLFTVLFGSAVGCGNTGDLYLPEDSPTDQYSEF